MKRIVLLITTIIFSVVLLNAQQGIGVTNPDASSVLELSSTTKGLLMPRMTTVQMNAIATPANGLMIYNTTDSCIYIRRVSSWISTCSPTFAMSWSLLGNSGTVDGTNFIGTTDNIPFSMRVNNQRSGYIGIATNGSTFLGYQAGLVTTGTNNTFIGAQAGIANTTGNQNTAVGQLAFNSNTTGTLNTAVGQDAMRLNTTGNQNTALGESSLEANTTGNLNVALGHEALTLNTDGSFNVAIGSQSLFNNINAGRNLGIGYLSLYTQSFNNAGTSWNSDNMAIGYQALYNNQPTTSTNGYRNTAIGFQTLLVNTTGSNNISIGYQAGGNNTTGSNNVGLGYQAGNTINTGSNNTFIGYNADASSATLTNATAIGATAIVGASNSVVLGGTGANAVNVGINTTTPQYKLDINAQTGSAGNPLRLLGLNAGATSDSIISSNSGILRRLSINQILGNAWNITGNTGTTAGTNFIGTTDAQSLVFKTNNVEGMRLNTSGYLGIGSTTPTVQLDVTGRAEVLTATTFNLFLNGGNTTATGTYNTNVGLNSMGNLTTGSFNVGIGAGTMNATTTGSYNSALGNNALNATTTGTSNVAFGNSALQVNTIGLHNAALGTSALLANVSGNQNTGVGSYALSGVTTGNNNIGLGWGAGDNLTTGSDNIIIGYQIKAPSVTGTGQLNIGNLLYGTSIGTGTTRSTGNIGINTTTPQYKLDIDAQTGGATNPLRLLGLNAGATSDSIISSSSGVLRRLSIAQVIGNAWNITGNTGTTAGTNFIGTTDGQDVVFKTNSTEGMRLTNSTRYLGIGTTTPAYKIHVEDAGGADGDIAARIYNTNILTYQPSFLLQTSGGTKAAPTAVANTSMLGVIRWGGYDGSAFNDIQCTEIGSLATEAWSTTAHGSSLLFKTIPNATTTALSRMLIDQNGFIGIGTTTPNQQLEITAAMRMPATTSSTTGVIYKGTTPFIHDYKPAANDGYNTFMGVNAGNFTMSSATSFLASYNTGVGAYALNGLTSGAFNTAIGVNAAYSNTTGSLNTALGNSALKMNATGTGNTAVGNNTLTVNTASSNTAVGNGTLAANTTGTANTAMGETALSANTVGIQNTSIGQSSMRDNVGGSNNTALGLSALQANTSGNFNTGVGVSSLVGNLTGSNNTAIGYDALVATTSSNNVALGYFAGVGNTTGTNNTFVGYNTGATNTTGSNNTLLGYQANVSSAALTNAAAIGNGATVNASNKIRLGNTSVTLVETQGSFVTISDRRLKTNITDNNIGLNFIKAVRPVNYELKSQKGIIYDGFVAQEIDSIMQKLNIKTFSGLSKPDNTEGYYSVSYATFVVPLVNAVKELDAKNDKTMNENALLKAELERIKAENAALKVSINKNAQDIEAIKAALNIKQN